MHTSAAFFGGGFGTGFSTTLAPDYVSVDNGYIDKITEFGLVGAPFIFIAFLAIFFGGLRLITTTSRKEAKINVFPFSIMFVLFFINISESNLMYKHLATVLTAVAAALIASARIEHMRAARSLGRMRMNTTDPRRNRVTEALRGRRSIFSGSPER
jgi:O-antigen ligase